MSLECYWVVPLCHDEHSGESFVSIDDKVTSKLSHVFMSGNQFLITEVVKIAELAADHYRDLSQGECHLLFRLVVNLATDCSVEGGGVSGAAETTFRGVDYRT